jgi:hypothetical protein
LKIAICENDQPPFDVPYGCCLRFMFEYRWRIIIMVAKSVAAAEREANRHGSRVLFHVSAYTTCFFCFHIFPYSMPPHQADG